MRGVPVSARTAPVSRSATRISLRLRSPRGVKVYATSVRSGETAGSPSSPCSSRSPCSVAKRLGQASALSATASLVVSSRSTDITSGRRPPRAGLSPSTSLRARTAGGQARARRGRRRRRRPWTRPATGAARCPPSREPDRGRWSAAAPARSPDRARQTSDVSASSMKSEVAPVGADRQGTRARSGGHRLEAPVRRRLEVLALLGAARRGARRGPPRSICPQACAPSSMPASASWTSSPIVVRS